MEEKTILEVKPTWIIIIPHLIAMCVIVGIFTIWGALVAVVTTRIKVTDKRVEGKKGLLHTERMDSRIGQITSVKVTQGLVGKIFNYGTIYINTAGGNYAFAYIPSPEKVRSAINNAIDSATVTK
mgnify:CR=1 FL=1